MEKNTAWGGDNTEPQVDESTTDNQAQSEESTDTSKSEESKDESNTSEKTNKFDKLLDKHKAKFEEKDATIEELVKRDKEKDERIAQLEKQREYDVAVAKYGEDVVNNEEVKKARENFRMADWSPIPYEKAVQIAGIDVSQSSWFEYSIPSSSSPSTGDETKDTYTLQEVEAIAAKNPKLYDELRRKRKAGQVKFV